MSSVPENSISCTKTSVIRKALECTMVHSEVALVRITKISSSRRKGGRRPVRSKVWRGEKMSGFAILERGSQFDRLSSTSFLPNCGISNAVRPHNGFEVDEMPMRSLGKLFHSLAKLESYNCISMIETQHSLHILSTFYY
jgi:hypothetical protein